MTPLSGLDGTFLHLETADTPMHVGSLHLFDVAPSRRSRFHADVKRLLRQRLHAAPVFQRRLAPMPLQFANPVWVHDGAVDLDHHVQRIRLPAPGTHAQLEACVARLHAELLDRTRPLWRLYVIDGLESGQCAYYVKVHHAVLDGQAGAQLARTLFDASAAPRAPADRSLEDDGGTEHPGMLELAAAALKHDAGQYIKLVRHLPDVVKTLSGMFAAPAAPRAGRLGTNFAFGPKTCLNVPITGERAFAALSLPLAGLKSLATAHDAKLNDVVLALCSGALRKYLAGHGGIPKRPLMAAMPISLRAAGNTDFGTQATMSLVNLHTHVADATKRLTAIRDAAGAVKELARHAHGILPTDFPSIAVPWAMRALASLYGRSHLAGVVPPIANVVVSNVAGPQVPLYTAGARMVAYWPLSIVEHGVGLNITVMSYAGAMGFGFTTARVAVPDPDALAQALRTTFDELVQESKRRTQVARPSARASRRLAVHLPS
jgi:WS/DGAT/MGAT family acyltransferase